MADPQTTKEKIHMKTIVRCYLYLEYYLWEKWFRLNIHPSIYIIIDGNGKIL